MTSERQWTNINPENSENNDVVPKVDVIYEGYDVPEDGIFTQLSATFHRGPLPQDSTAPVDKIGLAIEFLSR